MPERDMGTTIKMLRLDRAWSQEQLADIAGLSVRTVQRIEQGQAASLETLKALASSFGVAVTDLQPSVSAMKEPAMTGAELACPYVPATFQDKRRRFLRHLGVFAVVMTALAVFNLTKSPDYLWFVWPLAGWSFGLTLKAVRLFWPR